MFEAPPNSNGHPGRRRAPPVPAVSSETPAPGPAEAAQPRPPIVLTSFGPRREGARYGGAALFSLVAHLGLIGLAVWLGREVVLAKPEHSAVVFRRPPPPPPPPKTEPPQEVKKGHRGRGVALPTRVAPEIQPDLEISFAGSPDPPDLAPAGAWLGGSGEGGRNGGWADGLASGTVIKRSLARDPLEFDTAWDCDFPEGVTEGKVVVRIRIHVTATGTPTRVTVLHPGPPEFNRSAAECARRQGFRPALDVNGQPREGDREVSILFYRMGSGVRISPAGNDVSTAPIGPVPDLPVKLEEGPATPTAG
jgi:TonB family protein